MGLFTYNKVKLRECAVHRHQNDHVHSNVHPAIIQYVQFTFAQNMNEFMKNHSMNTFRHNTVCHIHRRLIGSVKTYSPQKTDRRVTSLQWQMKSWMPWLRTSCEDTHLKWQTVIKENYLGISDGFWTGRLIFADILTMHRVTCNKCVQNRNVHCATWHLSVITMNKDLWAVFSISWYVIIYSFQK